MALMGGVLMMSLVEAGSEVIVSVFGVHELLLMAGGLVLLVLRLLKFPSLQDLQHICRYPAMEQYRLNTSIRQNTERSP